MRPGCAGGQSTERSVCMCVPVCVETMCVCVCVCLGMYRGLFRSLLGLWIGVEALWVYVFQYWQLGKLGIQGELLRRLSV